MGHLRSPPLHLSRKPTCAVALMALSAPSSARKQLPEQVLRKPQSVGSVPSLGDLVGHWKEAQLCFTELLAITMLVKRKASKVGQPGF